MIYVVLGMHKSGTTLVAQLLHASGINMVEDEQDISYDTGNKCERLLTKALNKEILGSTGESRFSEELLQEPLGVSSHQLRRMGALARDIDARHDDWGFKDPRTSLTYPAWADVLPSHRLVFVYRRYAELVRRFNSGIRQLQLIKMRRVLFTWTHYNLHCVRHLQTSESPALVLSYEALMSGSDELSRLSAFIDREVTDVRRESLRRNPVTDSYRLPLLARLTAITLPQHPGQVLRTLDEMRCERRKTAPYAC